jgi:ribosomal protein S18 acetylase RimI-like enzyme
MTGRLLFHLDKATRAQIAEHLARCDTAFVPPLTGRVEIGAYSDKIATRATRFESWADDALVGLVAAYCNDEHRGTAYVTSVSVLQGWQGRGIASRLLDRCVEHVAKLGFRHVQLEVGTTNNAALRLYERKGFTIRSVRAGTATMRLDVGKDAPMSNPRDYDAEIKDAVGHRYAYSFDFDVMHGYMMRSFEPFFVEGSLLELGSFKGEFTKRLLARFQDVTCVEASEEALTAARSALADKVTFVRGLLETASLPKRYDNVVLTHVLEHLDDPVRVLRRVNDEWLSERGRVFLVCPNANAPSRQIAVKMGLITHNAAVTAAEAQHGHRRTYSLDTLERDAVASGLKVVHRSGIFFKALANFQWDRLLGTDVVSREYLDGCFALGHQYPDLCASIYLVCGRGDGPAGGGPSCR